MDPLRGSTADKWHGLALIPGVLEAILFPAVVVSTTILVGPIFLG